MEAGASITQSKSSWAHVLHQIISASEAFSLFVSDQYRSALFLSPFYKWDTEKGRDLHKDDTGE